MINCLHHQITRFILIGIGLCIGISFHLYGQTGTIRGNVYAQETGEPVFMCNVTVAGTTLGMTTDENGFFSFSRLSDGEYTIVCHSLGLQSDTLLVTLKPGEIRTCRISLAPSINQLNEIEVSAVSSQKKTHVQVSLQQVTSREMKRIPQIGAEPDLAQFLQTLPGFIHSGEQGGQLYIRGGSEVQSSFLLDGIPVYNPFHSLSLFSVIDADILQSVSVYSGGFSSDLGGRISAIMDTKTRDGNRTKLAGKLSVSTLGINSEFEGPLGHKGVLQKTTFLVSGKSSLVNTVAPVIYPYTGTSGMPYSFTDLFGKLTHSGLNGNKISLTSFRFSDRVDLDTTLSYDWVNYGLGGSVVIVPNHSNGLIKAFLNYSSYRMNWLEKSTEETRRFSEISTVRLLIESVNYLGPHELKLGLETSALQSALYYPNLYGYALDEELNNTDMAAYIKFKMQTEKWIFDVGLRGSFYATSGVIIPEPRVGMKFNLSDRLRIKGAAGYYSQSLASVKSDQDVVNYFNGFILEPESLTKNFGEYQATNSLQTAWHVVAGIETEPIQPLQINGEVYCKYFPQTISYNRNKRFSSSTMHSTVPDLYTESFIVEKGWAYGADLMVKYTTDRFFSQISYSLTFVSVSDGLQTYHPHYDRRHNLNLVASYYLGNHVNPWELNSHFTLGSGFPFTPVTSYYGKSDLGDYDSGSVLNNYYAYGVILGETNSIRFPVFYRLDLTIKRTFQLKVAGRLEASFSLFNALNKKNIFYFDLSTYQVKYQLPILPVIGLKYSF